MRKKSTTTILKGILTAGAVAGTILSATATEKATSDFVATQENKDAIVQKYCAENNSQVNYVEGKDGTTSIPLYGANFTNDAQNTYEYIYKYDTSSINDEAVKQQVDQMQQEQTNLSNSVDAGTATMAVFTTLSTIGAIETVKGACKDYLNKDETTTEPTMEQ